jgi:hypothetical protein
LAEQFLLDLDEFFTENEAYGGIKPHRSDGCTRMREKIVY